MQIYMVVELLFPFHNEIYYCSFIIFNFDFSGVPVPVHLQVLITLRYLATGNHQLTISDCYEISQSLVCRCIHRVSRAIARMSHSVIKMPNNDEAPRVIEDFKAIAGMPGVIGCIDCTHIAIKRPSGDQSERFRNRKGAFSLNVQAVCGPKLQFFNVVARWPGSTHDANIFNNSRLCVEMEDGVHRGRLLGDAGYPCTAFLFTPLANPQSHKEIRYNRSHITTRNCIERAFGVLKRRFGVLGKQMQTDLENTKVLIITAAILHNLAILWRVPVPEEVVQLQLDEEQEDLDPVPDQHLGGRLQGNIERRQLIENHF